MRDLIEKVKRWGLDRNIVFTSAEDQDRREMMEAQARYTLKETAELLDAYADKDIDAINDAIGDILVTLIVGASNDDDILESVKDYIDENITDVHGVDPSGAFGLEYALYINRCFVLLDMSDKVNDLNYINCISKIDSILEIINYEFDQDMRLKDCLQLAYNEIKNRTGKLVNGQFIKDK